MQTDTGRFKPDRFEPDRFEPNQSKPNQSKPDQSKPDRQFGYRNRMTINPSHRIRIGMRSIGIVSGLLLLSLTTSTAWAQDNQSDITGPTVIESVTEDPPPEPPPAGEGVDVSPELLEVAEQLSADLERARIACVATQQTAVDLPRRFARGSVDPTTICSSLECEEFRVVVQNVESFLDSLDAAELEALRQIRSLRLW